MSAGNARSYSENFYWKCARCGKPSELIYTPYKTVKGLLTLQQLSQYLCPCSGCEAGNLAAGVYGICKLCAVREGLVW